MTVSIDAESTSGKIYAIYRKIVRKLEIEKSLKTISHI